MAYVVISLVNQGFLNIGCESVCEADTGNDTLVNHTWTKGYLFLMLLK